MARLQPDIVHSHLLRAHLAVSLASLCRRAPTIIMTEHQADPRCWALRLLRIASRKATVVTGVSEAVRRHLLDHGLSARRVVAIPNGIDVETVARAEPVAPDQLGLPEDSRVLLFVGRLTHQKGLDVLLNAFSMISAEVPAAHLLVAGDGEDRQELEHLAERLGLGRRVRFLGRRDDVPGLLKAAETVVLPSRWEGLSLVLLEAMAVGRPVVAARVEGHEEVLTDGETGLLVEPQSPEALASALRRLLSDASLAARLGGAAGDLVRRALTATTMTSRYIELYDELLVGAGQGAA